MMEIVKKIIRISGIVLILFSLASLIWNLAASRFLGENSAEVFVISAMAVIFIFVLFAFQRFDNSLLMTGLTSLRIGYIIVLGVVFIFLWNLLFKVSVVSDGFSYYIHAKNLAENGVYGFDARTPESHWPPGYSLLLTLPFLLFGSGLWIITAINTILYSLSVFSLYAYVKEYTNETLGKSAALILAFWPNYLFLSNTATKELMLLCLLILSAFMLHKSLRTGKMSGLLLSGLSFGLLALTQPAIVLWFPCVFASQWVSGVKFRMLFFRGLVVLAIMIITIAPWTMRNYIAFDELIPVTTSGGDVFYRANNELAVPGYNAHRISGPLEGLSSTEKNDLGYELAKDWIRNNPLDFLHLAFRKGILFAGNDNTALWQTDKIAGSGVIYNGLSALTALWWCSVLAFGLKYLMRKDVVLVYFDCLVILSFACFLFVDMVFEAGSRHHVPLYPFLAILAAKGLGSQSLSTIESAVDLPDNQKM